MPPQQQPNLWVNMIPIAAIFVIFYFFLIRPQQKQARQHQNMLESLKKGDKILTTGGLYGTIVGIKGPDLEVRFAENVKLIVARSAVAKLVTSGSEETSPEKSMSSVS
ncbi:MAG TPA: preprotein translocase subunit YajC [Elusimicrobia bacterium]|nr:preprotein translocase subunit YajC [Elusimicrobiota bacterium]HBT62503.1 preprotein translocase subunit YajC [Elusimicrobiota bacterium]